MLDYRLLVIRLKDAEWDIRTSRKLQFLLSAAISRPRAYVDMSAVTYMDASCLGKLAVMQRERAQSGGLGPATLILARPQLRELFQLVGFEGVWPIFGTLGEALSDDPPHDDRGHVAI